MSVYGEEGCFCVCVCVCVLGRQEGCLFCSVGGGAGGGGYCGGGGWTQAWLGESSKTEARFILQ